MNGAQVLLRWCAIDAESGTLIEMAPVLFNERCSRRSRPSRWVVYRIVESPAAELGRLDGHHGWIPMQKVPRGFNDLVERRAAEVAELVGKHVLPVFRLGEDSAPVFEASAVAVRVQTQHILVSAAHVFDWTAEGGVHLLLSGREQHPLETPARVTITSRPKVRIDEILDLGYVRLTAEEIEAIGSENFVEPERDAEIPARNWSSRNVLFGFQDKYQVRDDMNEVYNLTQTRYSAPDLPPNKHKIAGLDGRHFALRFDRSRIAHRNGRGGKPQFRGMSGGGVWVFDPYTSYSENNSPRLLGFLAGQAPRNKKALFGSRVSVLLEILAK
jgi:hypothetical protein